MANQRMVRHKDLYLGYLRLVHQHRRLVWSINSRCNICRTSMGNSYSSLSRSTDPKAVLTGPSLPIPLGSGVDGSPSSTHCCIMHHVRNQRKGMGRNKIKSTSIISSELLLKLDTKGPADRLLGAFAESEGGVERT